MTHSPLHLRSIAFTGRLALTLLLCVVLGGFGASAAYLVTHHENRDEQPGFTMDDVRGHYHGVRTGSSLVAALERNHPAEIEGATALPAEQRTALLEWLAGDRLSETFDDLDLGDDAPAEVLAVSCLDCHSRASDNPIGSLLPLEYWDDVEPHASSKTIERVNSKILLASTHTHALALGTTTLLVVLLMFLTRWPARMRNGLALLASLGLFVDLGAWWIARDNGALIPVIVIGGAAFIGCTCLMLVAVIADLWLPARDA